MAGLTSISPRDLFAKLFTARTPVPLDVRVPDDLAQDEGWFPGAHRLAFEDLDGHLAAIPPERDVVVVCQGGLKLSQGCAARLVLRGRTATYLEGGLAGWRAAGLPLSSVAPNLWVTDGCDVAAYWLATRLLPRPHEILRVAADQVVMAADRFAGQPLPAAADLAAHFDRPMPAVQSALAFASSAEFRRLTDGGSAGFDLLDAWARGAEVVA